MRGAVTLRFENVRRRFGALRVLDGVSGALTSGEMLLVTGPNGSGKSTLLRCLAGLLAPDAGIIEISTADRDGSLDARDRRERVGFLSPDLTFYDELTVEENLRFFARLRRTDPTAALDLTDRMRLPRDRRAGVLSSGMRQRLRWAWLELGQPALLLLDEPFQNLDPEAINLLRAHLARRISAGALAVVANPARLVLHESEEQPRELRLAG